MSAQLLSYEHVPLGFEIVIEDKELKAWNLWWNAKELTDDPQAWDKEIRFLNEMQARLGELTADQRLIRAHMAEFCRRHPLFPESIDILCREIGEGQLSTPASIGCEGRGLLKSLGHHDEASKKEQQLRILREYERSLSNWLAQGARQSPTDFKVFGALGKPTDAKRASVEQLISVIGSDEPSALALKQLSQRECRETHGESALAGRSPYPFCCLDCDGFGWSRPVTECGCCHGMVVDGGLLCAGTYGEKSPILEESTRFTEESVLAYAQGINLWLEGAPPKQAASPPDMRYLPEDEPLRIADRIRSSLGDRNDLKE